MFAPSLAGLIGETGCQERQDTVSNADPSYSNLLFSALLQKHCRCSGYFQRPPSTKGCLFGTRIRELWRTYIPLFI